MKFTTSAGNTIRNNTIVAGPRNDFATTGNVSAGIYLHGGSQGSIHECNIIDGLRFGVANQSVSADSNIVRNNLIRSKPAGSEIYNYNGAKTARRLRQLVEPRPVIYESIGSRLSPASEKSGHRQVPKRHQPGG